MSAHPTTTELSEPDGSPAPHELRAEDQSPATAAADRFVSVLTSGAPTLSWVVPLVRRGQRQRAYQVRAWIPGAGPGRADRELWDSGRVEGDSGVHAVRVWRGGPGVRLVAARRAGDGAARGVPDPPAADRLEPGDGRSGGRRPSLAGAGRGGRCRGRRTQPGAEGVPFPVSFLLGRVGWTSAPRTW